MADCEKRLLKQFLDGIETTELCKIVRSVYHGGGITTNSREGKPIPFKIIFNVVIQILTIVKKLNTYDNIFIINI
jgi:hypothetical protein